MSRLTVPDRRECVTREIVWATGSATHCFNVSVGFEHGSDRVIEVFYAGGMKEGVDLRNMAVDACILLSQLLQYGASPASIGKSLSAATIMGEQKPASIIGAIAAEIAK